MLRSFEKKTPPGQAFVCLTRGVAVKPLWAYVLKQGGQQAWERLVSQLPEADRAQFSQPISASAEYRTEAMAILLRLISKELLGSNSERMTEVGAFFIDEIMNSVYRTFLRLGPIPMMIRRMPILFERFHNAGSLNPYDVEKHSARARLGHPLLDIVFCRTVTGILVRTFELLGVKGLVFTHERCVAKGDDCCVYHARWE